MTEYVKITPQCPECGCDVHLEIPVDIAEDHKLLMVVAHFECCKHYTEEVEPNFLRY